MNTSSQDRITANRANALKSTGPKTVEGKAASKMNAVKHGILSAEALVSGENQQEFTALHEWFQEDLQPVGPLEVMLVGQVVTTHWRLRRVLAAESGEIKREADLQQASARSNSLPSTIEDTSEGCRLLQTLLSDTLLAVERDGELTLGAVFRFSGLSGEQPNPIKRELNALHFRQRDEQTRDAVQEAGRERRKQAAVTFINDHLRRLAVREVERQKKEEGASQLPQITGILPGADAMNRFIRYESMLNRQLFRAMKELRTLQEKREGKRPKSDQPKSERNPKAESRSEKIPNEPISPFSLTPTLSRPTGEGEELHASRQDQADQPN